MMMELMMVLMKQGCSKQWAPQLWENTRHTRLLSTMKRPLDPLQPMSSPYLTTPSVLATYSLPSVYLEKLYLRLSRWLSQVHLCSENKMINVSGRAIYPVQPYISSKLFPCMSLFLELIIWDLVAFLPYVNSGWRSVCNSYSKSLKRVHFQKE